MVVKGIMVLSAAREAPSKFELRSRPRPPGEAQLSREYPSVTCNMYICYINTLSASLSRKRDSPENRMVVKNPLTKNLESLQSRILRIRDSEFRAVESWKRRGGRYGARRDSASGRLGHL